MLAWEIRSRDFSVRHAGHGATHYHDGAGSDYVNKYDTKVFNVMPVTKQTLEISISFNPYARSVPYSSIIDFIKDSREGDFLPKDSPCVGRKIK